MSEEQPTFKVTDRRLFNADGTPREIDDREASGEAAKGAVAQDAASQTGASAQTAATSSQSMPDAAEREASGAGSADRLAEGAEQDESGIPGADDPASFINFLMSIASNAAAALGMMEHPVTGERGIDLQLAKHWIDTLGMLQQKTRGNLLAQEQQIFEGLLSDLRMQYVSLTRAATAQSPRGFTGRDIIGGK